MQMSISADKDFIAGSFKAVYKEQNIKVFLALPIRHNKNVIKSKHDMIRSIFLRLTNEHRDLPKNLLAQRAVSILDEVYGSKPMYAFELVKDYTKPIDGKNVQIVPDEILDAQYRLPARRKLALILKRKAAFENQVNVGDMAKVYNKDGIGERGICSTSKVMLSIDRNARSAILQVKAGKRATVTNENIHLAIRHDSFASTVESTIDDLDDMFG